MNGRMIPRTFLFVMLAAVSVAAQGQVTFDRQKTGERTFDYAKEGVSHYGLYADWFNDLQRLGGKQMAKDLWDGAEAYIEMWERAQGVRSPACARSDGEVKAHGFNRLRLGDDWVKVLERAGQPQRRGLAWTWCVAGKRRLRQHQTKGSNGRDCGTLQKALIISENHFRPPTALRPNGSERPAPRVRVTVYMYGDCGANKEAVTLLIISAFASFAQKSTGGVAGLPQTPPAKKSAACLTGSSWRQPPPWGR